MSALSEAYGNAAPPHEFTDRKTGKVYKVRLIDDDVKVAVEKRLYARARDIVFGMKDGMGRGEYSHQLHLLALDYQRGEVAFEGSPAGEGATPEKRKQNRVQNYLRTHAGAVHLIALLFQCPEMEVVRVMAYKDNQPEIQSLLHTVLVESFGPVPESNGKEPEGNAQGAEDEPSPPEPPPSERKLW